MNTKAILDQIINEIRETLDHLDQRQLEQFEEKIVNAKKIFVAGAGRSLMMIRGLAMRLMHMGYTAYVVGETVTPAIEEGDLLIIASGSGETATLKTMADKCKSLNADLAIITTKPESYIAKKADVVLTIDASTTKSKNNKPSIQPGANTFEQCVLLVGDAMIIDLSSDLDMNQINADLMKKHANLE